LEQIRARIFGTHIGNGLRSGRKVLRRPLKGEQLKAWYPPDPVKHDPLMLSIKAENAKLKLDRLRRRGKAPPKKGAGKRAGKKK
jgi:small subunit ribosomal protein S33